MRAACPARLKRTKCSLLIILQQLACSNYYKRKIRQVCIAPKIGRLTKRSLTNCVPEQDALRQSDVITDATPITI
ncbi:hypothetical protein E2C01_024472 [Portunus trituberculatus]|uniref:Uncharacterized protein n=1 Tax=Portunus trituberculatus TaxID=210409 RepID=A0A5B7EAE9_PORTR|nr:hypothetical protein [Portunus trituberculatus]